MAMTMARFALGTAMLLYGVQKMLNEQIQLSPQVYAKPLGESTGMALTWAFLGYSPVFQFLIGTFEAVPALLLLFTRTRRLGALLILPVLANVVLINFFLHLWMDTRWLSAVLLALNLFLIAYDFDVYGRMFSHLLAEPRPVPSGKLRLAAKAIAFAVPAAALGLTLFWERSLIAREIEPIKDFIGERTVNNAGAWKVSSISIDGRPIGSLDAVSFYFDFFRACVLADGPNSSSGKFDANRWRHTFEISGVWIGGASGTIRGTYRLAGNQLFLDGRRGTERVALVLQRGKWGPQLPW